MNSIINRVFHNNHVLFPLWVGLSMGGSVLGGIVLGGNVRGWDCPWVEVSGWDCPGLKCPVTNSSMVNIHVTYARNDAAINDEFFQCSVTTFSSC